MDHYFLTLIYAGGPLCTIQRLKAKCDKLLSNCAFNFNSRRYTVVAHPRQQAQSHTGRAVRVGPIKPGLALSNRCGLALSNPH
jgi:hypothetical protein